MQKLITPQSLVLTLLQNNVMSEGCTRCLVEKVVFLLLCFLKYKLAAKIALLSNHTNSNWELIPNNVEGYVIMKPLFFHKVELLFF